MSIPCDTNLCQTSADEEDVEAGGDDTGEVGDRLEPVKVGEEEHVHEEEVGGRHEDEKTEVEDAPEAIGAVDVAADGAVGGEKATQLGGDLHRLIRIRPRIWIRLQIRNSIRIHQFGPEGFQLRFVRTGGFRTRIDDVSGRQNLVPKRLQTDKSTFSAIRIEFRDFDFNSSDSNQEPGGDQVEVGHGRNKDITRKDGGGDENSKGQRPHRHAQLKI